MRAITAFKVIQGHRDYWLIVTDTLSRTVSELSQLVQILLQRGHFDSKFRVQGVAANQSFLHR